MCLAERNLNRPIQIHRAVVITRMIQAAKVQIRKILVETILEMVERIIRPLKATVQAEMIPVTVPTLMAMKRILEARSLRRKEAAVKWQISFRTEQYLFIRILSCP